MKLSNPVLAHLVRLAEAKPAPEEKRKYCRYCGTLIPYEAAYCPNCGAPQEPQAPAARAPEAVAPRGGISGAIAKNRRRIRVVLFLVSLAIFVASFLLGSFESLSRQEAEAIVGDFQRQIGPSPSAAQILTNNLILCLIFFVPFFGTAFMAFVGYSTGVVLSAFAITSRTPISSLSLALTTLALPWAWLEFAAYSLASTEGIMLVLAAIGRFLRREVRTFLIVLAVSVALLVVGAVVEDLAIQMTLAG